ncbi:MAG: hypothetical protein IPP51_05910 [Bacteroidetes bacterium]|nr:hypothetical protein [Bacteroidota bacterium]
MKLLKNSLSAGFHLSAWLLFLPILLYLIFERRLQGYLINDDLFNTFSLILVLVVVGVLNARFFIPRLLYHKRRNLYILSIVALVLFGTLFDLTFSTISDRVIEYLEKAALTTLSAIVASVVISTSVRIILDEYRKSTYMD